MKNGGIFTQTFRVSVLPRFSLRYVAVIAFREKVELALERTRLGIMTLVIDLEINSRSRTRSGARVPEGPCGGPECGLGRGRGERH